MRDDVLDMMPEAVRTAHAVHGDWLFGRVVCAPVNRYEKGYGWDGGPLGLATFEHFRDFERYADYYLGLGVEAVAVRFLDAPNGRPAERMVLWARVVRDGHDRPSIVGWPDDQPVMKGFVR